MDQRVQAVLNEYAARHQAELVEMRRLKPEEMGRIRDEFLIPLGPVVGNFVYELAKAQQAKVILELGMSFGYTSVYLGAAARETGGKVITTELDPKKIAYAKAMYEKAGLADIIEIRAGDARKTIDAAKERFDLVIVDLWKDLYVDCLDRFYPKLAPGAYIVGDNMIFPQDARKDAMAYRKAIRAKPHIDTVLLPIGNGIELSRYTAGLDADGIAAR